MQCDKDHVFYMTTLIIEGDLIDAFDLPPPPTRFNDGITFVDDYTVMKVVQLDNEKVQAYDLFRASETAITSDEAKRRLKLPSHVELDKVGLITPSMILRAPMYVIPSKLKSPRWYQCLGKTGTTKVGAGSHISWSQPLVELGIHQYLNTFLDGGVMPHITRLKSATCMNTASRRPRLYFELSRNDRTLNGAATVMSEDEHLSSVFQTLFALEVLWSQCGVCHNDMHLKNVMLEKIEYVEWRGEKLSEIDYIRYVIDDNEWILPRPKHIVRLTDFGCSTKWSIPVVGSESVLGFGIDGTIPNYPCPGYDVLTFLDALITCTKGKLRLLGTQIMSFVLGVNRGIESVLDQQFYNCRPRMGYLTSLPKITGMDALMSPVFEVFRKGNGSGEGIGEGEKIVTMCSLE